MISVLTDGGEAAAGTGAGAGEGWPGFVVVIFGVLSTIAGTNPAGGK
jgi:hypothetical protein